MLGTVAAVILRILSNPFSNVLQKKLTLKGYEPLSINFLSYLGLSLFCILFLWQIDLLNTSLIAYKYAFIGGIFGALGNGFLISALEKGDLSVLGPINSYKSVVAMLFGIFILKELPTVQGILGIFLVIYGSYFVFGTQKEGFSIKLLKRRDILYRILALIFTAIEAVFIKKVIMFSDILTSFVFWCWFGMLFSFVMVILKRSLIKPIFSDLNKLILLVFTTAIMQLSTNYVFNKMNVSYALALFQLSTIAVVIFGWKFFDEKDIKIKILGSSIMVLGSVLLILFN